MESCISLGLAPQAMGGVETGSARSNSVAHAGNIWKFMAASVANRAIAVNCLRTSAGKRLHPELRNGPGTLFLSTWIPDFWMHLLLPRPDVQACGAPANHY